MAKKKAKTKKGGKRRYQIEMTPLSLFLWGFCFLFLLAWVFVLGILVGRGFLPGNITVISDLKNQIAKIEEITSRKEPRQEAREKKRPEKDLELIFYERLSNKKVEARKKEVLDEKKGLDDRAAGQKGALKRDLSAQGMARKDEIRVPRKASSGSSSPSGPRYTVQLASLGELDRAEGLIRDLKEKGYSAYYYQVNIRGKTYYRIRSGKFDTKREAVEFARELERKAGIKGFVSKLE
ncbi:MAG: SPOR domain-containing protein [Deltaproteobacteria bacterium]|nr:SPOR domain-containing protein [Deltaproteobacteria bacterium]MBW2139159.1 SPOR domain-containing protein [Deltaproteobacteria bacterium]